MTKDNNIFEVFNNTNQEILYIDIGKNIHSLRKEKGFTQGQIAKKLGVSPQQVQKYEAGKGSMYIHTLIDLSTILGVNVQVLINKPESSIKLGQQKFSRDSIRKN